MYNYILEGSLWNLEVQHFATEVSDAAQRVITA